MRDLRTWLTSYAYWNQGGLDNVVSMFLYLARECFGLEATDAQVGCVGGWMGLKGGACVEARGWPGKGNAARRAWMPCQGPWGAVLRRGHVGRGCAAAAQAGGPPRRPTYRRPRGPPTSPAPAAAWRGDRDACHRLPAPRAPGLLCWAGRVHAVV